MGRIVGIDLGTTNSLVAYTDPQTNAPKCIVGPSGSTLCPSVVSVDADGSVIVGEPARRRLLKQPERSIYSVKRLVGRGVADIQDELRLFPFRIDTSSRNVIRVKLGDKFFTPPEISSFILRELKNWAEAHFGETVDRAVITVPAYFNDAQRQATKDAGRIAGLDVLRLVNEPTAAALAYGLHEKQRGRVAVYDLGGGTFDISVLKLISTGEGDIYQVLSTNGDTHLGGDDIDNFLQAFANAEISRQHKIELISKPELTQELRKALIAVKHQLSEKESATLRFALPNGAVFVHEFSRSAFESLIRPIVDRTMGPAKQALADAHLTPAEIDEVVLVGGTTRTPMIRRTVEEYFKRKPHTELNPDEVVALGAAVQANILERGVQDMLLLDVTPLSLGIETYGGAVAKIIPRNSTIPASAQEMYTTGVDNQTGIDIHVLQGERELAKDCRSLARFTLKVPPAPAGLPRIEVRFLIDANGILQVGARDLRNGQQHSVEVQPSYGINDSEIERMLEESIEYAEQDFAERQVIEARTESEAILSATQKALASPAAAALSAEDRGKIESTVVALKESVVGDDYKLIRKRIDELNHATEQLAELVMNSAVSNALEGRKIAEV
ncbi:MAG TPA: molecular chaperone DnaK [Candidatus Eisenbacteria bacterium]|jgi:Fe-S protein assembly chaperone HscA|nr:molecular chaperone DnaK [Candidatus Eisenbacteria bacterium]